MKAKDKLVLKFKFPSHALGAFVGYGGWFRCSPGVSVTIDGGHGGRNLSDFPYPNWNKFGSMWPSDGKQPDTASITFQAGMNGSVSLYGVSCGICAHDHLTTCRAVLLRDLDNYAPEVLFVTSTGTITSTVNGVRSPEHTEDRRAIYVKSCNRCGRFLPINYPNERNHLSFSNHCTREDLLPCKHGSFGRLRNRDDESVLQLRFGFQLECRFCKRYTVNGQHNPKRTAAQMKEDASRRRAFEMLLAEVFGENQHLQYRIKHGRELCDVVSERFGGKCFKCGVAFSKEEPMNLDHTRPLALLWPIDDTATALCGWHNSEKRDRSPAEYYSEEELASLSEITGIPLGELKTPGPNVAALDLLLKRKKWLFDEFLKRDEMTEERDGKVTGELLLKALDKAFARYPGGSPVKLLDEYHER
jgi:hypothetical protein